MDLTALQLDRARGVLLGTAAGDALGAGYEFGPAFGPNEPVSMKGGGTFNWAPGEWTDDTSMAVPVAQELAMGSRLEDASTLDSIVATWCAWAVSAPDVGIQTRKVLSNLPEPTATAARDAAEELHEQTGRTAGNGSLMRTAPVALAYLGEGQEGALMAAARSVSSLTHADPAAGDACALWCLAIRHAVLTGELDLAAQLRWLPTESAAFWAEKIELAGGQSPRDFPDNGWVVQALQGAWSAIANGSGLQDCLAGAVRGGNDTDTVAAIAGGLAGGAFGASAVPQEWTRVLHGWPALTGSQFADLAERIVVTQG